MENIKRLPGVVVRGQVPIPNNDYRLEIGRKLSLNAIAEAEKMYGSYCVILIQKNSLIDQPESKDVHPIGVLAKVAMKIKLPNGNFKVKFNLLSRMQVVDINQIDPFFLVDYQELDTVATNDQEEMTLVKMVTTEITNNPNQLSTSATQILQDAQGVASNDKFADMIANSLKISDQEKYRYIAELSVAKRLKMVLADLTKVKMINDLEQKNQR